MQKHIEIKSYTVKGIRVAVEIDYDGDQVALVDLDKGSHGGNAKHWVFAGRSCEYEQGWYDILNAMKVAMGEAFADLAEHNKKNG